jgi:hypothetical protein
MIGAEMAAATRLMVFDLNICVPLILDESRQSWVLG